MWTDYLKAFLVGGALCALGQVLIDRTKLTPARILTCYVVLGVVLHAVGVYAPLIEWAGAGASVPLTGFGSTLLLLETAQETLPEDKTLTFYRRGCGVMAMLFTTVLCGKRRYL